jgi:glycosyltransferase involved in cell wall biosynthesis
MMHLLLIHQIFLSDRDAGGTRHFEFGRHCVQAGHQVTVVASDVSYLDGKAIGTGTHETLSGIRILRAHMLRAIHRSFFWRVIAFLSFMVNSVRVAIKVRRVDLVMGTSPPLFQAASAWLVSALRRKPFLLEIRDLWPDFAIEMGVLKNPVLIWLSRRLERFLYWRADHILVNSPAYRDYLISRKIDRNKITLIPNGVDPDMFDPDEQGQAIRAELGLHDRFVVTYTGAVGPANDIPALVRAAERLKGDDTIRFLIVGDGKDRPRVEKMIVEKGLRNIIMVGPRPKAQMKQVLGASDACTATLLNIPMFSTTYPNKVFDYMAAGRPIVLGIDGVIRQVVEDAQAGIFAPPGDDAAIAEAVRQLKADPHQARKMGRRGRAHIIAHFNRRDHATQFLALLERMTS